MKDFVGCGSIYRIFSPTASSYSLLLSASSESEEHAGMISASRRPALLKAPGVSFVRTMSAEEQQRVNLGYRR